MKIVGKADDSYMTKKRGGKCALTDKGKAVKWKQTTQTETEPKVNKK